MRVSIDEDRHKTVHISGEFTGPFIDLELSPAHAYDLLQTLKSFEVRLHDLVTNWYECHDCGEMHPKTVQPCPNRYVE